MFDTGFEKMKRMSCMPTHQGQCLPILPSCIPCQSSTEYSASSVFASACEYGTPEYTPNTRDSCRLFPVFLFYAKRQTNGTPKMNRMSVHFKRRTDGRQVRQPSPHSSPALHRGYICRSLHDCIINDPDSPARMAIGTLVYLWLWHLLKSTYKCILLPETEAIKIC